MTYNLLHHPLKVIMTFEWILWCVFILELIFSALYVCVFVSQYINKKKKNRERVIQDIHELMDIFVR